MSAGYLIFLIVGRLLIYLGEKFAQQNDIKIKFLYKLLTCSLCSGVWLYTIMSLLTGCVIFEDWVYVPVFSEIVTGCFSAYVVYLMETGYKSLYEVVVV